jgi:adenylate cyclase
MAAARGGIGIVCADISGTTRLFHKLGSDEAAYAVERAAKRMERAIEGFSGKVLQTAPDQWVAEFPAADAAISAAIEIQNRVADLLPVSGIKLAVRIGAHWGAAGGDGARAAVVEAARRLLTMAGPSQILTSAPTAEALAPAMRGVLWSCQELALALPDGGEANVYRVQWVEEDEAVLATQRLGAGAVATDTAAAVNVSEPAAAGAGARLCVRVGGRAYLIDQRTPCLAIGRDKKKNDIVIHDPKASREHARIERRADGRILLVDTSTNGTFVLEGNAETRVREGELALGTQGRMAFGHSPRDEDAECLEFERA